MVFTPYSQASTDNVSPTPLSTQSKTNLTLPEGAYLLTYLLTHSLTLIYSGVYGPGTHQHNFWDFLKAENRMDKKMRKPDHPEYNRRTLHVPAKFLKDQTPAMVRTRTHSLTLMLTHSRRFNGGSSSRRTWILYYFLKLVNFMSCFTWMLTLE
jgi:hypothetical protein